MIKVAAIVVTYNRKELLTECIESLISQEISNNKVCLEVIIIDNASTDGTKEFISKYISSEKIIYINTGFNLGGAGGFQYGVRYAAENEYDYIWLMDDDSIPTLTALDELIKYNDKLKGKYGFLSSKVLWKDNEICKMNIQKTSLTKKVKNFSQDLVSIIVASFVSLFIPTKVVKELGLPIKEFFIWTDDWEYTRRISRKYPCYLVNQSIVIHKCNSNTGSNIAIDDSNRLPRYRYAYRNEIYFFRREGIKGFCYEVLRLFSHILRVIFKAPDNKKKRLGYIINGTKEGFKFNPKIEYLEEKNK